MINSLEATRFIAAHVTDEPIVASLGNAKYNLFLSGDRPQNFYLWNAMGLAISVGLGVAMARPQQKVIVLDGDGALLMNLNALATTAVRSPENLIHVVWDNRQHELTGGQPTATAFRTNLAEVARGAGIEHCESVETQAAFEDVFLRAFHEPGPWFISALTNSTRSPGRPPKSPTYLKHRFRESMGVAPE